ncbi:MAG: site-2 protease family protein [Tissierellia bacterium]|nr:site-2 protease family protein [Tissierellia bacterium]
MLNMNFQTLIVTAVALVITVVLHELAHGYMALAFGDDTAKNMGRLTLNPLAHLNPMGMLSLIVFRFGWANPVPVNFSRLRPRRLGLILVSIAGIGVNLILGFLSAICFVLANYYSGNKILIDLFTMLMIYNVSFAIFNILPLPPLDGSKLVVSFFPYKFQNLFYKYEKYLYILLLILVFTRTINRFISPIIMSIISSFLNIATRIIR